MGQNISFYDKKTGERYSKQTITNIKRLNRQDFREHDMKLYVSNKVIDKVYDMKAWIQDLPEVREGTKSFSAFIWEWALQRYGEERLKREQEAIEKEKEEKRLSEETAEEKISRVKENLKKNYIEVIVPGRTKKAELPRIDQYVEYIENGGIPISDMIKHNKFSEKEFANLVICVKALNLELSRTKEIVNMVDNILKFKKDIANPYKRTKIERLFAFMKDHDNYKFKENLNRNMFSVYALNKLSGHVFDIPKNVVQYMIYGS